MLRYVVRRLLQGIIVIFLISVATFGILHLTPGDPILVLIGETGNTQLTTEQIAQIRHHWGLDRPLYIQYLTWAGNMFRGNFGVSVIQIGRPVGNCFVRLRP